MKKVFTFFVIILMIFSMVMLFSCNIGDVKLENNIVGIEKKFEHWVKNSEPLNKLVSYVKDVTNEKSTNFIPVEDRVVVTDFDGTIYGENAPIRFQDLLFNHRVLVDPTYKANKLQYNKAMLLKATIDLDKYKNVSGYDVDVLEAEVYADMSREKFSEYVKNFSNNEVLGYKNITYDKFFIMPMVEILNYLKENGFTIYVVAGTDRDLMRTIAADELKIPYSNFIGTDVEYKVNKEVLIPNLGIDEESIIPYYYEYDENALTLRSGKVLNLNYNGNKVFSIEKEIGKKPVICFGNNHDDVSMAKYTLSKNKYKSLAFMLVSDDVAREYSDLEKELSNQDKWLSNGFDVISMRKDFATIYGLDVEKTN